MFTAITVFLCSQQSKSSCVHNNHSLPVLTTITYFLCSLQPQSSCVYNNNNPPVFTRITVFLESIFLFTSIHNIVSLWPPCDPPAPLSPPAGVTLLCRCISTAHVTLFWAGMALLRLLLSSLRPDCVFRKSP